MREIWAKNYEPDEIGAVNIVFFFFLVQNKDYLTSELFC